MAQIAMRNSILRHPNAVRSKSVAAKRCTVVHKARYVFLLDVVRVTHFRVHNLQKSRDIFTDPIVLICSCNCKAMEIKRNIIYGHSGSIIWDLFCISDEIFKRKIYLDSFHFIFAKNQKWIISIKYNSTLSCMTKICKPLTSLSMLVGVCTWQSLEHQLTALHLSLFP